MITLGIVLGFPLLLLLGYGGAYALLRDGRALAGWGGLALYLALLAVPLIAVLAGDPGLLSRNFAWGAWTPAWMAAGAASGLALAGARWLLARGRSAEARVWPGPPGRLGYAAVMAVVASIVAAEEVVWRGYLQPEVGLVLAASAFALHHYHFGLRHVLFTFGAGLAWGALSLLEERLFGALSSHLAYNAVAWAWMRQAAERQGSGP